MDADGDWPRGEGEWEDCGFYGSLRLGDLTFLIELGTADLSSGRRSWAWKLCGYSKRWKPEALVLSGDFGFVFRSGEGDGEWYLARVKEAALRGGLWWLEDRLKELANARERAKGSGGWRGDGRYIAFNLSCMYLVIGFPPRPGDCWWLAGRGKANPLKVPHWRWVGTRPPSFTMFEKTMAASAELGEVKEAVIEEAFAWLERHKALVLSMLPSRDEGQASEVGKECGA
jgi:hypothetical protein